MVLFITALSLDVVKTCTDCSGFRVKCVAVFVTVRQFSLYRARLIHSTPTHRNNPTKLCTYRY